MPLVSYIIHSLQPSGSQGVEPDITFDSGHFSLCLMNRPLLSWVQTPAGVWLDFDVRGKMNTFSTVTNLHWNAGYEKYFYLGKSSGTHDVYI